MSVRVNPIITLPTCWQFIGNMLDRAMLRLRRQTHHIFNIIMYQFLRHTSSYIFQNHDKQYGTCNICCHNRIYCLYILGKDILTLPGITMEVPASSRIQWKFSMTKYYLRNETDMLETWCHVVNLWVLYSAHRPVWNWRVLAKSKLLSPRDHRRRHLILWPLTITCTT